MRTVHSFPKIVFAQVTVLSYLVLRTENVNVTDFEPYFVYDDIELKRSSYTNENKQQAISKEVYIVHEKCKQFI